MKKQLGPLPLLFPMPALLVGTANKDGTANAMTAAWSSVCCHRPPCVGVAIRHNRLTFSNLQNKKAFTLNIPKSVQAAEVDYLGMISGEDQPNKLDVVGFEATAGTTVDAPNIAACPVNIECKLVDRMALGSHSWFVGEVTQVHVDETFITPGGQINVNALDPLIYATSSSQYHAIGDAIANAYSVGKSFIKN